MRSRARRSHDVLSSQVSAALGVPGRTLGRRDRAELEVCLGGDLSAVRVHEGPAVDHASAVLGARGFAVGRDVALAGSARPDTLAHEAAHALQQDMVEPAGVVRVANADDATEREARTAAAGGGRPVTGGRPLSLERDLASPGRLGELHKNIFVLAPGGGKLKPWQAPTPGNAGTAALIHSQAKTAVKALVKKRPGSVGGTVPTRTSETDLDADALAVDVKLRARFPQIATSVSAKQLKDVVSVLGPSITATQNYLRQWLANKLRGWSDISQYEISEKDPRFIKMLDDILADKDIGAYLKILASRVSGFQQGAGTSREIYIHKGVSQAGRRPVLYHELTHFYSHSTYRDWGDATTDPRLYNEGMTEWLARKAMPAANLSGRTSYDDEVKKVKSQIVPHVPEDGIARAFFRGEVWRLETRSAKSRSTFEAQTGISESGTRTQEIAASRSSGGLFQTVAPGEHFRFLNLGNAEAEPKSEHEAAFRGVKTSQIDPNPTVRLRFVGHASGPGSESYNRGLSRRRSVAFYRMARREGVPWKRMVDANRPPHFGESRPTVTEEDVITRAMNRRVEMFLVHGGTP